MKKIHQLSIDLAKKCALNKALNYPEIIIKKRNTQNSESFSCHYTSGTFHLEAESPVGVVYGLHQLQMGIQSGHQGEYQGTYSPKSPLRPLWIGCPNKIMLTPCVGVHIPDFFLKKEEGVLNRFCQRLLELGYNSVLLGSYENNIDTAVDEPNFELNSSLEVIRSYGIKVILKPVFQALSTKCPLDSRHVQSTHQCFQDLFKKAPAIDFIFHECCMVNPELLQDPSVRNATDYDLVIAELSMLEQALEGKASLIFYVPTSPRHAHQQSKWLSLLCDDVGPKTIVAFSAVSGVPWADHLSPHPFWKELRQSPDCSATPLLPIINIGCIRQGEGLWPTLTLDLIEKYFPRCHRHHFAGVIGLVNYLPASGALLECNLWVASQELWKPNSSILSVETWFRAQRPDLDFDLFAQPLREIRILAIDLSLIRSLHAEQHCETISNDERRALAESIWARLKKLQIVFEANQRIPIDAKSRVGFADYFLYFLTDTRRILFNFIKNCHISIPHIRHEDNIEAGFWTTPSSNYGLLNFLEQPQEGPLGSGMAQIFAENRLFLEK